MVINNEFCAKLFSIGLCKLCESEDHGCLFHFAAQVADTEPTAKYASGTL